MGLGWPAEVPPQKPRMPYDAVVHYERYGERRSERGMEEAVAAYDRDLAAHYRSMGRTTTDDSWTADVVKKFSVRPGQTLRGDPAVRGFDYGGRPVRRIFPPSAHHPQRPDAPGGPPTQ